MLCQPHKKLGGGTARAADPDWPKGYSIPWCMAFVLPTKLSLSPPTTFLTFTLPILSSIPPQGVSKRLRGAYLFAGVKP